MSFLEVPEPVMLEKVMQMTSTTGSPVGYSTPATLTSSGVESQPKLSQSELENCRGHTGVNLTSCYLAQRFPGFDVEIPDHWRESGVIDPIEAKILAGCLVFLIALSYSANTLWLLIYKQ